MPSHIRYNTLNTPFHAQHYWVWCVYVNSGWPNNRNLIANDSMNLRGGSDTILYLRVEFNQILQNWLVNKNWCDTLMIINYSHIVNIEIQIEKEKATS
jgi:hypothetical protein